MTNLPFETADAGRHALEVLGRSLLQRGSDDARLRWPDEKMQANYTGASGEVLLRRTVDFLQLLHKIVPCLGSSDWRGLDYGVGWGRLASLMTTFGDASNLDCADAWRKSLDLARSCGLQNQMIEVPAYLPADSFVPDRYDFIYSYSIFTHLPDTHIVNNLSRLIDALKPGGQLIFTLREPRFLEFLQRAGKYKPSEDRLEEAGYWFGNAQNADYGDTVVTEQWIQDNLGPLGALGTHGVMSTEPYQAIHSIQKSG
ncbi:MAG: class I SAM-dependent methyltransferase [Luteimonas sp.]